MPTRFDKGPGMHIHFLYGTETGNSEMLCEDMIEALGSAVDTSLDSLADVTPADLSADRFHVFVTSTYGTGDLPATAQPFAEALDQDAPDLSQIRFAIFGLGDMVFEDTFAHGSERLMEKLLACKAQMVGERAMHDASGLDMPEDIAIPWVHGILAQLNAAAA